MITIKVYDWEFRCRMDGTVECRNEQKDLDWAQRDPAEIDFLHDQISMMRDAFFMMKSIFPEKQVIGPTASGLQVQQPVDHSQIM